MFNLDVIVYSLSYSPLSFFRSKMMATSEKHPLYESDDDEHEHSKDLPILRKVSTKKQLRSKVSFEKLYVL